MVANVFFLRKTRFSVGESYIYEPPGLTGRTGGVNPPAR